MSKKRANSQYVTVWWTHAESKMPQQKKKREIDGKLASHRNAKNWAESTMKFIELSNPQSIARMNIELAPEL